MDSASATLRHQLQLLREIARHQAEDIDVRDAECKWLDDCLRRRLAAIAPLQAPPAKGEVDSLIEKVKIEVDSLQCELGVWRGATGLMRSSGASSERCDEAKHELEHRQWQAERERLARQLHDVKEQIRQLEATGGTAATGSARKFVDMAAINAEAGYFRDELAAERSATAVARERLAAVQQEIEDEKQAQALLSMQDERDVSATLEEIALVQRRIEVERELQQAQQAQLESVQSTIVFLKEQLQRTQQEMSELRLALKQNQDMLRRLRQ